MEVMVEILLSLLAQPSNLMRQVVRSVFGHVCSHLTPRGLQLILAVSWGLWRDRLEDGSTAMEWELCQFPSSVPLQHQNATHHRPQTIPTGCSEDVPLFLLGVVGPLANIEETCMGDLRRG